MKQEKKVNSYLRGVKVIAIACVFGGVIGGGTGMLRFLLLSRGIIVDSDWALQQIRSLLIPILGTIFAVTVILEEICMQKLKGICERQLAADDDECDQLEYEEEKVGAFATNLKLLQKTHPEKKGDPSSPKFQEQWLDSCDEAEKEVIYRSAYKAYMTVNRTIPVILILVMLANLYFDTGMLAVIVLAVIWMLAQFTYTRSYVRMKKSSFMFSENRK